MVPAPSLPDGTNNIWFNYSDSDTVLVFVHGVLSNSRSCWLNEDNPGASAYWPSLIKADARFRDIGIFLGGYYTAVDAGPYEVSNCADELYAALERTDQEGRRAPLAMPKIIFVCHSMGGIVARNLLERNWSDFKEKSVGLVLIASPTYGSNVANGLEWLMEYFNNQQGLHLRWGSWSLEDLDDRFRDIQDKQRIPNLTGIEFYENRFIFHRTWLPSARKTVVPKSSLGRYFGRPFQIPDSDHFSICKPKSNSAHIHQYLYDFLRKRHLLPTDGNAASAVVPAKQKSNSPSGAPNAALASNSELDRIRRLSKKSKKNDNPQP